MKLITSFAMLFVASGVTRGLAQGVAVFNEPLSRFTTEPSTCNYPVPERNTVDVGATYEGRGYGPYASVGQMVCTDYAEQVLTAAGYAMNGTYRKMIHINHGWDANTTRLAVLTDNPLAGGVAFYLVATNQGTPVIRMLELAKGDWVQYWRYGKNAEGQQVVLGHTAQVVKSLGNGEFELHGAHGTLTKGGRVHTKVINLNLGQSKAGEKGVLRVYAARPKGNRQ